MTQNFGDALLPSRRVLVVGDVMLDSYIRGAVDRISPEAPVPVLRRADHHDVPGGAANVAANIAALGGEAFLVGVVGPDEEAGRIEALMATMGVAGSLVVDESRPTIAKTRILAGGQQLLRIDREETRRIAPEAEASMIAEAQAAMASCHAVVLSDYAKGALTDAVLEAVIAAARKAALPVIVDPKRRDFEAYAGASYITPNRSELAAATGLACATDEDVRAGAGVVAARTGADVLVTRSEHGMALVFASGAEPIFLSTEAREVFDVSGAGDTVAATFALAIAGGAPPLQALRLSNYAASVVIGKSGTATLTQAELSAAMARSHHTLSKGALVPLDEAVRIRREWRQMGLTVGFTNGCFDLLHPGHISLLREAAEHCDRLIVALNTDASVRRLKGPSRPVQGEQDRAEVMGAIGAVDLVVLFDEDTPLEAITALAPDVLVKGADYAEADIVGGEVVRQAGGRIVRAALRAERSTSALIARSHAGGGA